MVRNEGDHYWLHDGAHRFFAARELGWDEIDVFIGVLTAGLSFAEFPRPILISKSRYKDSLVERTDEPWRAEFYLPYPWG